ncbi:MAG: TlpA family protein disulfide reductase [Candidatus Limnocylindria bacterium]
MLLATRAAGALIAPLHRPAVLVATLSLVLAACTAPAADPAAAPRGPITDEAVDRPLPAVEGALLGGGTFSPDALGDARLVVVNFWASWCGPCRREQPDLASVAERYRSRGVVMLGVNLRDAGEDALAFAREFGVSYPSVVDSSGALAGRFGVVGVPTTFIVRGDRIVHRFEGAVSAERLGQVLEAKLALSPTGRP